MKTNGHYEIPLLFRSQNVKLQNNLQVAFKRLESLKRKLLRDSDFRNDYCSFMNKMIEKGYATVVVRSYDNDGKNWFIPHHGVYHPVKNKIRVVFDCSSRYQGTSLNEVLLAGPDLGNNLAGVLLRFHQGSVALMADIEAMFYQVKVPVEQRSYLQFLWWKNNDFESKSDRF